MSIVRSVLLITFMSLVLAGVSCGKRPAAILMGWQTIHIVLAADGSVMIDQRRSDSARLGDALKRAVADRAVLGVADVCDARISIRAPEKCTWQQLKPMLEACAESHLNRTQIADITYLMPSDVPSPPPDPSLPRWGRSRLLRVANRGDIATLTDELRRTIDHAKAGPRSRSLVPVPLVLYIGPETKLDLVLDTLRALTHPDVRYYFTVKDSERPVDVDVWIEDPSEPIVPTIEETIPHDLPPELGPSEQMPEMP